MTRDICSLVFISGLLLQMYGLAAETTQENTGAVFVSQQTAHTVLHRQRRYNTPLEEMFHKDNLERECREEVCSMEEAREVFENDERTMEFWAGYIDGNQCDPPPCQNGGTCEDGIGNYVCWCKPNFSGKNCEIDLTQQCSVNNGGCSHFCTMQLDQAVCQCAAGYQLGSDKKSCVPQGQFSCGRVESSTDTRSAMIPRSSNAAERNSNNTLQDDYNYDEDDLSQLYDYFDLNVNNSDPSNISQPAGINTRSVRSAVSPSVSPNDGELGNDETPTEGIPKHSWGFAKLPTIKAEGYVDQRVVGGDEATPGEIPWQVTLMTYSTSLQRGQPFCGGSLLSELWVITAAHCLMMDGIERQEFFVRAGEHDVTVHEGSERDYQVAERHFHHSYDFKKSQYNHDIALLKLASPVELSNKRRPICLGPKDFTQTILRASSSSTVSGWGRLRFGGPEATKLQKLEVPYVDRTDCKQSSRYHITRFMFCAGYLSEQKDSCQGDSGGPHATKYKDTWFLTGIVSWGEECAMDGKYGIYTRVSRYLLWISQKTGIQISN